MKRYALSYVLTTYNKLPFLKEVLRLLLLNKQEDEEIVVADGGSTDGTAEYLTGLYKDGKIDQFISERDKGEAHGYNKTFLTARGDLIKVITDDDVFYYPAIQACRKFMEENPCVDMMTGMAAMVYAGEFSKVIPIQEFFDEFKKWQSGQAERFYSNGLALMLRRKSLPVLGLFNHDFTYVDIEYTLRTSKWARIAFCEQCIAVRVTNLQSKAVVNVNAKDEMLRLFHFYNYPVPSTWKEEKPPKQPISLRLKIRLSRMKKKLQGLPPFVPGSDMRISFLGTDQIGPFYRHYERELAVVNEKKKVRFYQK